MYQEPYFYLILNNAAYIENGYRKGYTQGVADGLSKVNVQYIYHSHSADCYSTVDVYGYVTRYRQCGGILNVDIPGSQQWGCGTCGAAGGGDEDSPCYNQIPYQSYEKTGTKEVISCGKTEDTIESATIIY